MGMTSEQINEIMLSHVLQSKQKGKITHELASDFIMTVTTIRDKVQNRAFRTDQVAYTMLAALAALALRFDETKSQKPYAYFHSIARGAYSRHINMRKLGLVAEKTYSQKDGWEYVRINHRYFLIVPVGVDELSAWAKENLKSSWTVQDINIQSIKNTLLAIRDQKDFILAKMVWG